MRYEAKGVAFVVLSWASAADAQDGAEIVRGELIAQIHAAVNAREWARVVELTVRAGEIRWTPSLRMWSATAHAELGHPLEALDAATRCATEALANERLNNRREILERCNAVVDRVRPQVGRVVVRVPAPPPAGLQVTVQGIALAPALWGAEYPVLPGTVHVEARSREGAAFEARVEVAAQTTRLVRVVLVAPRRDARVTQPPIVATREPGVGPWVTVGTGGALLVGSAVFYGLRGLALQGVTDEGCSGGSNGWSCPRGEAVARASYDRARTYEIVSGVMLGVGAAAVAGGLVWYFVARPGSHERRRAFHLGVTPAGDGAWLTVGGTL